MLVAKRIIKNSVKYTSIILTLTILFAQVYIIINERSFTHDNNIKITFESINKAKYCEDKRFTKYYDASLKCFFAFFWGCLLSEMKFLKSGIM